MEAIKKAKRNFANKFLIKFSESTGENIEEINSVLEQTFAHTMDKNEFAFVHSTNFVDNLKEIAELGGKTFVVKYGKKIVGTISYKPREIKKWYYTGKVMEACHLAVLPEYQKLGLGNKLFDLGISEASKYNVPIIFSTPEKNVKVVNYYVGKEGVHKIEMSFVKDHYAVRFIIFNGEEPYTSEYIEKRFTRSAMIALMRHYKECNEIANADIRKLWNNRFYPYFKDEPEDVQQEMILQYRKKRITPRKFVQNRETEQESE